MSTQFVTFNVRAKTTGLYVVKREKNEIKFKTTPLTITTLFIEKNYQTSY